MGSSAGGGAARDQQRVRAVLDALFPKPPKGSGTLTLSEVAEACGASPKTVGNWRTSSKVPNDDSLPLLIELVRDACGESAADELAECYGRLRARNEARSRDGQSRAGQFNAELAGRRARTPAWLQRLLLTIRADGNAIPTIVSRMDARTAADDSQATTHWRFGSHRFGGRSPSYVPRDVDAEIDHRLSQRDGVFVIIVGEPRSGKTRTLAEALYRHPTLSRRALHEIPRPSDGRDTLAAYVEALNEALVHGIEPPIVFIDDLHNHLRSPETGLPRTSPVETAIRLVAQHATVVATSHPWLLHQPPESSGLTADSQRWLIEHSVTLAVELSNEELHAAQTLLKPEDATELLRLGEALGGIDLLTQITAAALVNGTTPARAAVIRGLIDHQLFNDRPGSLAEIEKAAMCYYSGPYSTFQVQEAITWATRPVEGAPSLAIALHDPTTDMIAIDDRLFAIHLPGHMTNRSNLTPVNGLIAGHAYWTCGVEPAAERWLRFAADAGLPTAMTSLGIFQKERGQIDGPDGAIHWQQRAADVGDMIAMVNLGFIYDHHHKDQELAASWYRLAAESGDAKAMHNIGCLRHNQGQLCGDDGAEFWYRSAIARGYTDSILNLGQLLWEQGKIIGEDGADIWLQRAARAGDLSATHNIGILRERQGQIEGADGAKSWYLRSAASGNDDAKFSLASLLEEEGDLNSAEHWYRIAAHAGHSAAMNALGILRKREGCTDGPDGAEHWYEAAARAGSPAAMRNIGLLRFEAGDVVGDDSAEYWWRLSANKGHRPAMRNLQELRSQQGVVDGNDGAKYWQERLSELDAEPARVAPPLPYEAHIFPVPPVAGEDAGGADHDSR